MTDELTAKKEKANYVITEGLIPLFNNRYGLSLSNSCVERITQLEKEYSNSLSSLLDDIYTVHRVTANEIEGRMETLLRRHRNTPLLVLDDVYFRSAKADSYLSVTREVLDPNEFDTTTLRPRPGDPPLSIQYAEAARLYSGQAVSLLDIGTFSAQTLLEDDFAVIKRLRSLDVRVESVFFGMTNNTARSKLENENLIVHSCFNVDLTNGDWLESRDLLAFDGRKIARDRFRNIPPRAQFFAEYIRNTETLKDGAAIQDPKLGEEVISLSRDSHTKIIKALKSDGIEVHETRLNADPRLYYILCIPPKGYVQALKSSHEVEASL